MRARIIALTASLLAVLAIGLNAEETKKDKEGWIDLFNGKNTDGWKLRAEKVTTTTFTDKDGKLVVAKLGKVDQKEVAQDSKGKEIKDAKIVEKDGKKIVVDGDGKPIEKAKVAKTGGRDAAVDINGKEIKDAKIVKSEVPNPNGWTAEKEVLVCAIPHGGNDLLTEKKFTDFELHVEFLATSNSGVYLQGRYEIQVNNDFGKPTKNSCGSLYGLIAPSKNMNKKAPEWNTWDISFRAPRGDKGKVTKKGRVTLVWNGEKVIDDAEIDGPTGGALDSKVLEPGPILLQGDHGKVSYRNIRIKPLDSK